MKGQERHEGVERGNLIFQATQKWVLERVWGEINNFKPFNNQLLNRSVNLTRAKRPFLYLLHQYSIFWQFCFFP